MNPSTASNRLVKDILYSLVVKTDQNNCFKCNFPMTRETFTIEHKEPWLDSDNPVDLYFDLENISFSHHKCNVGARRKTPAKCGSISKYSSGCRCDECRATNSSISRSRYCPEKRSERYRRNQEYTPTLPAKHNSRLTSLV